MSICFKTGLPHVDTECDACAASEARLAYARTHPSYLAAKERSEAAWIAYQAGRKAPAAERRKLEEAWRAAGDDCRTVFSAACSEYNQNHPLTPEGTTAR